MLCDLGNTRKARAGATRQRLTAFEAAVADSQNEENAQHNEDRRQRNPRRQLLSCY